MYLKKKDLARRGITLEVSKDTVSIHFDAPWPPEAIDAFNELTGVLGTSTQDCDIISQFICDRMLLSELQKICF